MSDPTDLRGLEREQVETEQERKVRRAHERGDFKWLMKHPAGRRFIWRLLQEAGVHRTTFHPDPATYGFREGMRNMGLILEAEILEVCPEQYLVMVKEQKAE